MHTELTTHSVTEIKLKKIIEKDGIAWRTISIKSDGPDEAEESLEIVLFGKRENLEVKIKKMVM